MKKQRKEYEKLGAGSYILEFKFKERWWAIDATMEDGSIGRLINHSKKLDTKMACHLYIFWQSVTFVKMMKYCMIMLTILKFLKSTFLG